jgi:hypothetical protein
MLGVSPHFDPPLKERGGAGDRLRRRRFHQRLRGLLLLGCARRLLLFELRWAMLCGAAASVSYAALILTHPQVELGALGWTTLTGASSSAA